MCSYEQEGIAEMEVSKLRRDEMEQYEGISIVDASKKLLGHVEMLIKMYENSNGDKWNANIIISRLNSFRALLTTNIMLKSFKVDFKSEIINEQFTTEDDLEYISFYIHKLH